jgi:hypothetical protein
MISNKYAESVSHHDMTARFFGAKNLTPRDAAMLADSMEDSLGT